MRSRFKDFIIINLLLPSKRYNQHSPKHRQTSPRLPLRLLWFIAYWMTCWDVSATDSLWHTSRRPWQRHSALSWCCSCRRSGCLARAERLATKQVGSRPFFCWELSTSSSAFHHSLRSRRGIGQFKFYRSPGLKNCSPYN